MKTLIKGLILVPAIMFVLVGTAYAATLVVRPDPGPGEYDSIAAACADANAGDTVLVYPGHYMEAIRVRYHNIKIISTDGPLSTIIERPNGAWPKSTVWFEKADGCTLSGFTLINQNDIWAMAYAVVRVRRSTNTTVTNNIIDGGFDGILENAVGGINLNSVITNNVIRNAGVWGIDSYAGSLQNGWGNINSVYANNTIHNCGTAAIRVWARGGRLGKTGEMRDCYNRSLIVNNVSYDHSGISPWGGYQNTGISVYDWAYPEFFPNGEPHPGYGVKGVVEAVIRNNIFYPHPKDVVLTDDWEDQDAAFWIGLESMDREEYYNDYVVSNNNIYPDVDPLLVGDVPGGFDYHLAIGSPCIDAGTNDVDVPSTPGIVEQLPTSDADGNPRIFDGDFDGNPQVDIGAYEFGAGPESIFPETLAVVANVEGVYKGIMRSLETKLDGISRKIGQAAGAVYAGKLNAGELLNAAANKLNAFTNEVQALRGTKLSDEEADLLLESVMDMEEFLDDLSRRL